MDEKNNWKIRHYLKPGDIGYLTYIHGIYYAKEYGYDQTFEAYVAEGLAKFVQFYNSNSDKIWIMEEENQIIGSIAIVGHSKLEAQLRWFFVHPNYQGLGLGKYLLNETIQFCKKQEFKVIFLWTTIELKTAIHLYLKFGFVKTEENSHKIWGKTVIEERYDLSL